MMYGFGGWNPWMLSLLSIGILLFWGFLVWGGLLLFRRSGSGSRGSAPVDTEQILNGRLARGEISTEEYDRQRIGSST
jgi:uncharacterized membrane protein